MKTITVMSRKGGSGKTTTVISLAAGLRRSGARVLLIDLDSQANLSYLIQGDAEGTAMDLLTGSGTAAELIHNDLISAGMDLAAADRVLTGSGIQHRLSAALNPVRDLYDYCIIDTPAALGVLTTNALTASDYVVITVQADPLSIKGIDQVTNIINAVRNKDLQILGSLTTRYNGRTVLARQMLEVIQEKAEQIGCAVYQPIRECTALRECAAMGMDIFQYAPRSNGAADYSIFIEEIRKGIEQ